MREIRSRQTKIPIIGLRKRSSESAPHPHAPESIETEEGRKGFLPGGHGVVYGLVSDLLVATKIARAAQHCHLAVHNFDRAEPLLEHARAKAPNLAILDWDSREAEAYKVLQEFAATAVLKKVPTVGFVSMPKASVREEAQKAGCHRVYTKTEFSRDLEQIMMRYTA